VEAEGWYRDPYLVHEDRWFSSGQPTQLVRDGGVEAYDPPPAGPPKAELVEARHEASSDSSDLRRADDPSAGAVYDPRAAAWGTIDSIGEPPPRSPEPPLDESPSWREGSGSGRG
jgi:hypothetical protein